MYKPKISLIAALAYNRVIGFRNAIPWSIPEDQDRFKKLTQGHVVIIGRKTFESIGRKPFSGRTTIVVSREKAPRSIESTSGSTLIWTQSLNDALRVARELEPTEIFVAGGRELYVQTIGLADKLYLTLIDADIFGDTHFPAYNQFTKVISEQKSSDKSYGYTFLELEKEV